MRLFSLKHMKRLLFLLALLLPALSVQAQDVSINYVDGVWKDGATTYKAVAKFGRNGDIDTGSDPEDLIDWGGLYGGFVITTTDTILVVSDAGADSIGGTGALTYTLEGLDSNKRFVTVTDTMRGTLADTAAFNWYRVFRAYVASAGSGATNAGNITVKTPKDSTLSYITAAFGQSQQATYTVGTDFQEAYLTHFYVNAETPTGTAGNILFRLEMRPLNGAWRVIETFGFNSGVQNKYEHHYEVPKTIPAGADVRLRVQTVAQNNTSIAGGFELWLVK